MMLWLHGQGYTFFSICRLTYPEISMLINAKTREVKKQNREQKKMERKNKSGGRYR